MSNKKNPVYLLKHDALTFTTFLNEDIESLKNMETLAVYVYLALNSLDESISKAIIKEHFNVSLEVIDGCMDELEGLGLINKDETC